MESRERKKRGVSEGTRYLAAARVVQVDKQQLRVRLEDDCVVPAALATLVPYQARLNDELLVIRRGGEYFAIGVLRGRGTLRSEYHGDFHLSSLSGSLGVRAQSTLSVAAPEVELQAHQHIGFASERSVKRCERFEQGARAGWVVKAGQQVESIRTRWFRKARRVVIKVARAARFNGKTVRLG